VTGALADLAPVAIVTGGSRGIGHAIVTRLVADGYRVVFTYREREATARELVERLTAAGGEAHAVRAELADADDITRVFQAADAAFGRLDALVLNAAAIPRSTLTALSPNVFDHTFAVNVRGAFLALRHAAQRLEPGGRIVALSTRLTKVPGTDVNAYAASKAALETLCRSFAHEVGPREITVNVVQPGITDTEAMVLPDEEVAALLRQTPLGRIGRPDDIAAVVRFLLSEDARWLTGQVITASGGL
jgi:3-oxoacyl-[acyl-carrier protein] reductase